MNKPLTQEEVHLVLSSEGTTDLGPHPIDQIEILKEMLKKMLPWIDKSILWYNERRRYSRNFIYTGPLVFEEKSFFSIDELNKLKEDISNPNFELSDEESYLEVMKKIELTEEHYFKLLQHRVVTQHFFFLREKNGSWVTFDSLGIKVVQVKLKECYFDYVTTIPKLLKEKMYHLAYQKIARAVELNVACAIDMLGGRLTCVDGRLLFSSGILKYDLKRFGEECFDPVILKAVQLSRGLLRASFVPENETERDIDRVRDWFTREISVEIIKNLNECFEINLKKLEGLSKKS